MKAAASATNGGEQGNRGKKGNPHFISNFGVCENHRLAIAVWHAKSYVPRILPHTKDGAARRWSPQGPLF